jgi:hypothetical protein
MGGAPRDLAMTRICWWLVDRLARVLEPNEREAVRGDFAESGESAVRALLDVLGLVVRRQAALWKDWRPWVALAGLVVPLGMLLSLNSISVGRSYDLYVWVVRNSGVIDPSTLKDAGLTLHHGIGLLVFRSLLLGTWSWTSGFALASLSRRTVSVNAPLFFLILLCAFGLAAPRSHDLSEAARLFPLFVEVVLVLLPSLWGMHQGLGLATLPLVQPVLWAATVLAATAIYSFPEANWQIRLLRMAEYWPAWYVIAIATREHWGGKRITR